MKTNYKKLLLLFSFFLFIFFIVGFSLISVVGYNSYAKSNKLLAIVEDSENVDFETGYVYENNYSILSENSIFKMSFDNIIVTSEVVVGNETINLEDDTLYVTDLFYNAFKSGVFKGDLEAAYKNNKSEIINAPLNKDYLNKIILKMEDGVIGYLNLKLVVLETNYQNYLNDDGFVTNLNYYLMPYMTAKTLFKLRNNNDFMFLNGVLVYSFPFNNYNGASFASNNIYANDAYLKDCLNFDEKNITSLENGTIIPILLKGNAKNNFSVSLYYKQLGFVCDTNYFVVVSKDMLNNIKNHFNYDSILESESPTNKVKIFQINEENVKMALNNDVNFVLRDEYSSFNNFNNILKIVYLSLAMVALASLGIEIFVFRKSFGSELVLTKINVFSILGILVIASLMSYLILVLIF